MYNASLLTAAMGFPTTSPTAPVTRKIRMLFAERDSEPTYKPKKVLVRKQRDPNELSRAQKEVLRLFNKHKELTASQTCELTHWTQNHTGILLSSLHERGLLKRRKESGGNARWYVYSKKETA